ncbi:MAG: GerMN domain-containing protein [Bacillus sp. (in: firmicutes)]
MSKKTNAVIASTVLVSSVLLGGCGLFENKKIDPPQNESLVEDGAALNQLDESEADKETAGEEATKTVMTELYLIDKNGYVVPQSVPLPSSEGVAKQALEHLVDQGPVSNILPNGFRAVLPADTELTLNVNKGVATVDFSPEFASYAKEDELKILQSITWTLTQFDSIEQVKLQMNGKELAEMPVNKTPIPQSLTRAGGINIDTSNVANITDTVPLTVYYLGGDESNYYQVPVTKRVAATGDDLVETVVKELAEGPSPLSNLVTEFMPELDLVNEPELEDGKLALDFNEVIYGSFKENTVSQRLMDSLVLSLTEQPGIDSVEILVNGKASLVTEEGKELSKPVSRPEKVNAAGL